MTSADRDAAIHGILALNSPDVPFAFAESADGAVGVWDYADAKWAGLLSAGKISRSYELTVVLHDDKTFELKDFTDESEARVDRKGLHYERNVFSGTAHQFSFRKTIAPIASDHGQVGQTFGWTFDTEEMKAPVRETLERSGWTHRNKNFLDRLFGR